jgi:hypothetical protein
MAFFSFSLGPGSIIPIVQASSARKADAETRLRFYDDRQIDDLRQLIAKTWKTPETFRLFFVNIVRKIIDKKAQVYKAPPIRQFQRWDQRRGDDLYRMCAANRVLKKANRLTKLCKTAMLQVGYDIEHDRPTLAVVTPNLLDVKFIDPEFPERVIVTHPSEKPQETTYSDWTATTYERFDYRGFSIPIPGNPGRVNPYGVLPLVPLFDREPDGEFFLQGGGDLVEAQRAVNVGLANLWRAIELQSHGQAWAKGVDSRTVTHLGPSVMLTLPENGAFGFAQPQAPIEEVLKAIEFVIKQTAVANDLAANVFEIDSKAESGAAKAFETRDLVEAREDDLELWRVYETRLFEVIKRVVNTHKPGSIPEAAELFLDFGEITDANSQTERLDSYQRRIDMGIWSPVDALMADNPDFRSREDAIAELQRRRDESSVIGAGFAGPRISN